MLKGGIGGDDVILVAEDDVVDACEAVVGLDDGGVKD